MPTSFQTFNPGDLIQDTHVEQFIEPIQNLETGKPWYGQDSGSSSAFQVALDPAPSAYTEGMMVHFKAAHDVSGATTIDVNGLGSKALLKEGGDALTAGDIAEDQMISAIYDGADFRLISAVLNPSISPTLPTENLLVYSEVAQERTSTAVDLSLPSFVFDGSKSYLLETRVDGNSNSTAVRITFNDGTNSYAYPSTATTVKAKSGYESAFYKLLPNLSGSHTIVVNAAYTGFVEVKLYEVYDSLVYADFTASQTATTPSTSSLSSFTAASGHTYLVSMTINGYTTAPGASVYLTSGATDVGIPQSGPTSDLVTVGTSQGSTEVSRIITGLSGAYTVTVRGRAHSGVSVRIFDIT
jgi:hypothetical protein